MPYEAPGIAGKETTPGHLAGDCAAGCAAGHEAAGDQLADALAEVILCVTGSDGGDSAMHGNLRAEIRELPLEAVAANLLNDARRLGGFDDVAAMIERFQTAGSPVG